MRTVFCGLLAMACLALPLVLPLGANAQLSVPHAETITGVACRVVTGEQPGPVVLITGDADTKTKGASQTADAYAIEQIAGWSLSRGKVVLVSAPMPTDANTFNAFMHAVHPNWVVHLRDDQAAKAASVQAMLAPNATPDVRETARKLQTVDKEKTFSPSDPFARSVVSAGRPFLLVIAAGGGTHPAPSVRTRYFRRTVAHLLDGLTMVGAPAENGMVPANLAPSTIRVAMYDSDGAAGAGPGAMETALSAQTNVCFRRVCATDIQTGALSQFDVLINPGGNSAKQGRNLSDTGRAQVQKFIGGGGGYLGICAGCYLASGGYKWSLGLVDADVADKAHSSRGRAMLQMELTPKGREVFGNLPQSVLTVLYHNGPVLAPTGKRETSTFEPLAIYRTEIAQKRGKKNIMVGSAAIAADRFGKGRVIGISPHPEQTPGLTEMVPRAVRWLANRPL